MKWPEDWDKPSEGNAKLCRKFAPSSWNDGGSFSLNYRFYIPKKDDGGAGGRKYPLALYLHGADAFGSDNMTQLSLHDIGTMFAKEDWQESEPCYILAPQCLMEQHWSRKDVGVYVMQFLESFIRANKDIDRNRIYIYGYSAGGIGVLNLLKKNDHFFAGAVPICGATSGDKLLNLLNTPMWMIHAADDRIVKATYGNPGMDTKHYLGSRDIYDILQSNMRGGSELRYTEYPKGWMKKILHANAHCSWAAVSDDVLGKNIRRWLFEQKRTDL